MKTRKQKRSLKQKGGDEFLIKPQHKHLKNTLARLGPYWYKIEDVWRYANSTITKPTAHILNPDLIYQYVFQKTQSPRNEMWFLAGNELVKYIPLPGSIANVLATKNMYMPKNNVVSDK